MIRSRIDLNVYPRSLLMIIVIINVTKTLTRYTAHRNPGVATVGADRGDVAIAVRVEVVRAVAIEHNWRPEVAVAANATQRTAPGAGKSTFNRSIPDVWISHLMFITIPTILSN